MLEQKRDRSSAWAVIVSLGLHGAGFGVVAAMPDRAVEPAKPRMTLVDVAVEVQPPDEPPEPPVVAPEPPKPVKKRPVPAPVPPPVVPVPAPVPPPVVPVPAPPAAVEPLVDDRPRDDAPKAAPLEAPTPERPRLIPTGTFALTLDAGTFADVEVRVGLRAPSISKDLVGDLTKETIGRGKVDRGLVHPYFVQLGKSLIKQWDADRAVSAKGLSGFGEQFLQNSKVFNEIWLDKAAQYGATGAAIDAPVSNDSASRRTATTTNTIAGITGVDLEARKEVSRQLREQFKATRRATIRVVQNADGKLTKVELLSPSNDAQVDREALADVRAAAEKLPAPPAEVLAGRTEVVSTWAFELVVSISPPIPTFTFEFDEALGFIDARLPLDRRIYKKVRLVSVD